MPLRGWLLPYVKPQRVAARWVGFLQSVFRNYRVVILLLQLHEFVAHRFDDGLHSGQVVDVVHLVRVVGEVVKLPVVDIVVEVDEFITAVAHAVVAFHSVLGGIFVEVVVESIAPLHILVAAKQWHHRHALYVARDGCSCQFEEGGSIIDVLHHFGDVAAAVEALGQTHHQWGVERFLIHKPLVEPAMFAYVEALVGGIHHESIVDESALLEIVEHATHVIVEAFHHLHIVAHIALEFPFSQFATFEIAAIEVGGYRIVEVVPCLPLVGVHALNHIEIGGLQAAGEVVAVHLKVVDEVHILKDAHFLSGGSGATLVVVVECARHGECAVLVEWQVLDFGEPITVNGLVVNQYAERFVLVALSLHPVDALIGDNVGEVAFMLYGIAVHLNESRIVVIALTGNDFPHIEACGQALQMPFAEESSLIARALQHLGESGLRGVEHASGVVGKAVGVAVLAGEHTGATRSAERVGHITACESHTVLGNAVEIGCMHISLVVATHHLRRMVVGHDVHYVKRLLFFGLSISLQDGGSGESHHCHCLYLRDMFLFHRLYGGINGLSLVLLRSRCGIAWCEWYRALFRIFGEDRDRNWRCQYRDIGNRC